MSTSACLLDAGFDLTLRPMRYPRFYEMYRGAIKNTWTVEEIDFQIDLGHLRTRMTPAASGSIKSPRSAWVMVLRKTQVRL